MSVNDNKEHKKEHNIQKWNNSHEQLLGNWANKANCYIWLHEKSHLLYKKRNMYFAIPIIILSTISGTANYGIASIFPDLPLGNIIIGTIGLIVAIISFINNFFRHAELSESHRVSNLLWNKFHRNLSMELSLHRNERKDIGDYLLFCQTDMDRLIEQSPLIPEIILSEFKRKFMKKIIFELPAELDTINPVFINNNNKYNLDYHHYIFKLFNINNERELFDKMINDKYINTDLINEELSNIEDGNNNILKKNNNLSDNIININNIDNNEIDENKMINITIKSFNKNDLSNS
jgi:hypothetical protein